MSSKFVILLIFTVSVAHQAFALYNNVSFITALKADDFEKTVVDSHDIWIVEFYAKWCGHCQQFAKDYKKAARALRPYVKFAAVNGHNEKKLANKYMVEEYPTVLLFGFNKEKPEKLELSIQDMIENGVKAIKDKANELLKPRLVRSLNVIELYDDNFYESVICSPHAWLVYFYGSNCFECADDGKVLIKAASTLRGQVKVGAMDMETNKLLAAYKKGGVRYFPYDRKTSFTLETYDSKMNVDELIDWVLGKLEEERNKPHVFQLISEEILRESCEDKPMCIVFFLPEIKNCALECRMDYLELLRDMAKKYENQGWGWVWTPGGDQPGIENALDISSIGYPSLVAVDVKKKIYFVTSGTITHVTLGDWFDGIVNDSATSKKIEADSYPNIEYTKFWCDVRGIVDDREDVKDEL